MQNLSVLIIGGGIGGLTSAIALGKKGFTVEIIEKDPDWSVYGVGIIQQSNVIRAVAELGIIDDYLAAGFPFNRVDIYLPNGDLAAKIPAPKLTEDYPAQLGIGRRALQKVLADSAKAEGANIRLGIVPTSIQEDDDAVTVEFSDGSSGQYDLVIGADGVYSQVREMLFPELPKPEFAGQSVWRYNFERPADMDSLSAYEGKIGCGLVPLSKELMYMFVTTPEPGNPKYPKNGLAKAMREKLTDAAPLISELAQQITDDDEVVYKPLEWIFVSGNWYKGRVVMIGDAVHATTPHLGQGAGMAIEDSVVLAEELSSAASINEAFAAFQKRRFDRCQYIVEQSVALCKGQIGEGPLLNQAEATGAMFKVVAEPL